MCGEESVRSVSLEMVLLVRWLVKPSAKQKHRCHITWGKYIAGFDPALWKEWRHETLPFYPERRLGAGTAGTRRSGRCCGRRFRSAHHTTTTTTNTTTLTDGPLCIPHYNFSLLSHTSPYSSPASFCIGPLLIHHGRPALRLVSGPYSLSPAHQPARPLHARVALALGSQSQLARLYSMSCSLTRHFSASSSSFSLATRVGPPSPPSPPFQPSPPLSRRAPRPDLGQGTVFISRPQDGPDGPDGAATLRR